MSTYAMILQNKRVASVTCLKNIENNVYGGSQYTISSTYDIDFPSLPSNPKRCFSGTNENEYISRVGDICDYKRNTVRSLSYAETVGRSLSKIVHAPTVGARKFNTIIPKDNEDFDLRKIINPRRCWVTVKLTQSKVNCSRNPSFDDNLCFYSKTKSRASKVSYCSVSRTSSATTLEMRENFAWKKEKNHGFDKRISSKLIYRKNADVTPYKNIPESFKGSLPKQKTNLWTTIPIKKKSMSNLLNSHSKVRANDFCELGLDSEIPCEKSIFNKCQFPITGNDIEYRKLLSKNEHQKLTGGGQSAQSKVKDFLYKLKEMCLNSKKNCRILNQHSLLTRSRQKCCELKENNIYSTLLIPFFNENATSVRAIVCCQKNNELQSLVTTHIPICVGGKARWGKSDEKTLTDLLGLYGWNNVKRSTIRLRDCPDEIAYSLQIVANILSMTTNECCNSSVDELSCSKPSMITNYIECGVSSGICNCQIPLLDCNNISLKRKFDVDSIDFDSVPSPQKTSKVGDEPYERYTSSKKFRNTPDTSSKELPYNITFPSGVVQNNVVCVDVVHSRKRVASSITNDNDLILNNSSTKQQETGNAVWTKQTHTFTPEGERKEISIESVSCLRADGPILGKYVVDEVIYAFCSLVTQICTGSNNVIDPLIVSYLEIHPNYRHSDYPKHCGNMYFPICRNSHWVLAVFDFDKSTAIVLDSNQHTYDDKEIVHKATQEVIFKVWKSFTDIPLHGSNLSNVHQAQVCKQLDQYNCGIYVCFHLVRLLTNMRDDPSKFSPVSADQYREQIRIFLRANFHVRDENRLCRRASHIQELLQATDVFQTFVVDNQNVPLPIGHAVARVTLNESNVALKDCTIGLEYPKCSTKCKNDTLSISSYTVTTETNPPTEQLFELSKQCDDTDSSHSNYSKFLSKILENICANNLNKTVLMSSDVLKYCYTVQTCCIYDPYTNSYVNLVLPIVKDDTLCAIVIVKKIQQFPEKAKKKIQGRVTVLIGTNQSKFLGNKYETETLRRIFKLHGINGTEFTKIHIENKNGLELLYQSRSSLCDEQLSTPKLFEKSTKENLSSLNVCTEYTQGNLVNGFCRPVNAKCGCPMSLRLDLICSHLTKLQTKSSKSFVVLSPQLLTEIPSGKQNCAVWNKHVNNYEFALMPIEIGDMCGLIHYSTIRDKKSHRTKTTLYVAHATNSNKYSLTQEQRKKIRRIFLNHGLPITGIQVENDVCENVAGYLCYKALSLVHSIEFSLYEFLARWETNVHNLKKIRGCAHLPKCSCKLYGESEAKSSCAIYNKTHLLPNGSTIGPMNIKCKYCGAWRFASETSSVCCQNGKVEVGDVELSQSVPDIMRNHKITVMNDKELFSKTMFMNNSMSLASNIYRQRENVAPGEKSLIIQGKYSAGICHVIARNPKEPAFAQLYLTAENIVSACLERYKWQSEKTKAYMLKVMEVLKTHNVLVQSYVNCDEAMKVECERLKASGITKEPRLLMNIKDNRNDIPEGVLPKDVHKGRINAPAINNQVAVIWVGEIPNNEELVKGIRVRERGGQTVAPHFSANLDGLLFVILFPKGEVGYIHDVNMYKRPGGPELRKRGNNIAIKQEDCDRDEQTDNLQGHDDALSERMEAKENYVSRREFTIYMLSRRDEPKNLKFHRILGWGKLSAQWILFSWVRVESDRISHISANVTEYRGVEQSELFKFLDSQLQTKNLPLGSLTQLPSSYPHAMKWFMKQYENSMTVVQKEGNPDLFITFTGNSEWKEIKDNLIHDNDSWITDPMLCARVFHEKLQQLLQDIVHAHVFGKVKALQYSIEFQKRGMPHAHILITLETKLIDPNLVDKIVSAELPELPPKDDPTYDSVAQLRAKVIKHMIHRPCWGKDKMACRQGCVNRPKCQKNFPHDYSEYTFVSNHGKHIYKRRKGNPFPVGSRNVVMANNCDVVPYNKYLLSKYDCHINVEVVCSATACKYIFKYIYKGPDQLVLELIGDKPENVAARKQRTVLDEKGNSVIELNMAKEHVNARYLGQVEASYRLLGYALQGSLHTVITLKPHTPGNKYICFRKGIIPTEVKKSELEAYFDLIKTARENNTQDKDLLWTEVAEQFIFDTRKRSYIKRKRSKKVVAAIRFVPPKFTELYALRLLLTKKATSGFEDIRCVEKILHPTFMEAAVAAGYIHEDEEWDRCLTLVSHHARPKEIRRVFASLLIYCQIVNGRELWEKHKHSMRNRFPNWTPDKLDQFSLSHIDWILRVQGSSLNQCNMIGLLNNIQLDSEAQFDPDSSQNDSVDDLDMTMSIPLNVKQKHALDTVMNAVQERMGVCKRMFFLYGKAGCGKTFLYNRIIAECRSKGKRVVAVASTGIAATLLWGGRTAHSTFKIPIQLNDKTVIHMDANSPVAEHLRNADIFLWDEAPMQSRFAMEAVDRMLRDIVEPHRKHLPFGGTTVVFGGDWSQFLPVVRCFRGADLEAETIKVTLKNSNLWDDMQVLTLDLNMRVSQCEKDHMHWLRCVGEGTCQYQNSNCIDLPEEMYVKNEGEIINWLYTPEVMRSSEKLSKVALLSVRNDDTLNLNEKILQKISGKEFILHSADESANPDNGLFGLTETVEYINTLTPSGMPPHKLTLRIGCIVMLLRNIDVSSNLCNGTRLELLDVLSLGNTSVLKCRQLNSIVNSECYIQRIPLTYSDDQGFSGMAFRRVQFPVRLSFAMTINKSQGQTFDKVGLILRTPAFAHGSTYVALSRATSKDGIRVTMNREFNSTDGSTFIPVRNIVYQSLINDN